MQIGIVVIARLTPETESQERTSKNVEYFQKVSTKYSSVGKVHKGLTTVRSVQILSNLL